MKFVTTPGSRLWYFAHICFERMGDFTQSMGYKESGTVYDYFNGKKPPRSAILNRFYSVGGNPQWVESGKGCIFADNDIGRELQTDLSGLLQLPSQVPFSLAPDALECNENLYLLMSLLTHKISAVSGMTPATRMVFREMLRQAQQKLEEGEPQ